MRVRFNTFQLGLDTDFAAVLSVRRSAVTIPPAGRLTQRLEYLAYTEGVRGSNPLSPTGTRIPTGKPP